MEASDPVQPHVIDTASGKRLDLDNPRPEDIRIKDVAGGLSKVCRFGAQAREYYSVAQHALLVQRLVVEAGTSRTSVSGAPPRLARGLPLRHTHPPQEEDLRDHTKVYKEACETLDHVIAGAFGFEWPGQGSPEQRTIKRADRQALLMEAARLLPDGGEALRRA